VPFFIILSYLPKKINAFLFYKLTFCFIFGKIESGGDPMLSYHVNRTKHSGFEPSDFSLSRPAGATDYLLLHFQTPVRMTLRDEELYLPVGSCVLLRPATPHAFTPVGGDLIHDWMHFMPSDREEFERLGLPLDTVIFPNETGFITSLVKQCEMEHIDRGDGYEAMISSHVSELMIRLLRQLRRSPQSPHADAIHRLRHDVYRDPDRFGTTEDMAHSVGLSRSRFAVVYRELIGVPPKNDLIRARVSKATYLLSLGTRSLSDISETCGYQSVYHFIRQFRAVTGITPGKYRKST
jgi:AraC family transcriptional regulator of arabinose operon